MTDRRQSIRLGNLKIDSLGQNIQIQEYYLLFLSFFLFFIFFQINNKFQLPDMDATGWSLFG